MSSGERPIGAAKGKQSDTEALCHPPPPQSVEKGGGGGGDGWGGRAPGRGGGANSTAEPDNDLKISPNQDCCGTKLLAPGSSPRLAAAALGIMCQNPAGGVATMGQAQLWLVRNGVACVG